jgi:hypothetical protein
MHARCPSANELCCAVPCRAVISRNAKAEKKKKKKGNNSKRKRKRLK